MSFKLTSYYQSNFQSYFKKTVGVNPSPFLVPFIDTMKKEELGRVICDIGCGSGRDMLWLKERGFSPVGFEKSVGLAMLASRHSGCNVIVADFEYFV